MALRIASSLDTVPGVSNSENDANWKSLKFVSGPAVDVYPLTDSIFGSTTICLDTPTFAEFGDDIAILPIIDSSYDRFSTVNALSLLTPTYPFLDMVSFPCNSTIGFNAEDVPTIGTARKRFNIWFGLIVNAFPRDLEPTLLLYFDIATASS